MKNRFYALWLAAICILVFLLQVFIKSFTDLFVLDQAYPLEVWRFLTSIFLHGGIGHLVVNMFALALFGSILESLIGSKRFLMVFFVSGIMANIISFSFYPSSLGASGAIMGVIGALVIVKPLLTVWAFGMPMPMFIAGIIWVAVDLLGAVSYLSGNPLDNTGNIAHLSGMFFGIVLGLFYREWKKKEIQENRMDLNENYVRSWEDFHMKK